MKEMGKLTKIVKFAIDCLKPLQFAVIKETVGRKVLDLGCGTGTKIFRFARCSVGIDIFAKPKDGIYDLFIQGDLRTIDLKGRFDVAILFNVIEHLRKDEGYAVLNRAENWVKKIVVITSEGFNSQEAYDGNPYMEHRSGWTKEDFEELGYKVKILKLDKNILFCRKAI